MSHEKKDDGLIAVTCPTCKQVLKLQREIKMPSGDVVKVSERAAVALCYVNGNPVACDGKLWGSAKDRYPYGREIAFGANKTPVHEHYVQIDPPGENDGFRGVDRSVAAPPAAPPQDTVVVVEEGELFSEFGAAHEELL